MGDRFKGCGWFVFVDLINVAILITFSAIILIIPNTMKNCWSNLRSKERRLR